MSNVGLTQPRNTVVVIRGESKTFQLSVVDEDGEVVNLTGSRILLTVKKHISDVEAVIRKDSDKGSAEVDIDEPKAGKAKVYVLPSDTVNKDVREYVFDVWVVLSSGAQHPVIKTSVFQIVAGVTVLT